MSRPDVFAVTYEEAGDFVLWEAHLAAKKIANRRTNESWGSPDYAGALAESQRLNSVHSIIFDDGSAWDAVNGWRRNDHSGTIEMLRKRDRVA